MPRTPLLCVGALSIGMGGLFVYNQSDHSAADPIGDVALWEPTPSQLGLMLKAPELKKQTERFNRFAELFQSRYRGHTPPLAVGICRHQADIIEVKFPARLETWHMNRIAFSLWQEANANLGSEHVVDIYETYIGTRPRKIGELRRQPGKTDAVTIRYLYDKPR